MRSKINKTLFLISLIAVIASTASLTFVYYRLFEKQVWEDLKESAGLLVQSSVFEKGKQENLSSFSEGKIRITWIDEDGTVLFDNDADKQNLSNHLKRPEIIMALKEGEGSSRRKSDTMGFDTFYYAVLLENRTILRVGMQAATVRSHLFAVVPYILPVLFFVLTGSFLLGLILVRQIMKPLDEFAEHMDENRSVPVYSEFEPFADKIRSQHEKILLAVKSRQDFTANVSHELKTPITAICGYAELIENRMVDENQEVHIACQIRHNAERLLSLINDIIRLSELDHEEIPRNFENLNLYSVASESVEDLSSYASRKGIRISISGVPVTVNGDRALLREMADNLIQNAVRYNREGGSVEVITALEDSFAVLYVKDTGIGIPSDQIERVFERFYRVDKSRSRETGGTGLGLAIVKHIAELHNAQIIMTSHYGVGTKVKVLF